MAIMSEFEYYIAHVLVYMSIIDFHVLFIIVIQRELIK